MASKPILAWTACLLTLTVFMFRVVVPSARNPYTVGFAALYAESRILLEDPGWMRLVYDDARFQPRIDQILGRHVGEVAHGQPPTMSLMLAPLAWLSPVNARASWILLSTFFWASGLIILSKSLGLGRFYTVPPALWLTAASTVYLPIVENLRRGQGYALLFFLLCFVVRELLSANDRRGWMAGIPLGLMIALKSAGLWLVPLILVTRRRHALLWAMASLFVLIAFSTMLMGWDVWRTYFADALVYLPTEPTNRVSAQQTVMSLMGHLFIPETTTNPAPLANLPFLAPFLGMLVVSITFVVSARIHCLTSKDPARRALTVGMFVSPLVSVAPVGEGYHYVLIFPAILIGWWWVARRRVGAKTWAPLALFTTLIWISQRYYGSDSLRNGWLALLAYPRVYGAFGLWGWFVRALRLDPEV